MDTDRHRCEGPAGRFCLGGITYGHELALMGKGTMEKVREPERGRRGGQGTARPTEGLGGRLRTTIGVDDLGEGLGGD